MTTYVVHIPGCAPDYFTWPTDYCAPLFSQEPLEGAKPVEVKENAPMTSIEGGFYYIYNAWKSTYERIWTKLGGEPSKNILTIRHEFSKWLKDSDIKVLDCTGINLFGIDLWFVRNIQDLQKIILCNCNLSDKHADQLEEMLKGRNLQYVDLSNNRRLSKVPRLENVVKYIAKNCGIYERPADIEIDLQGNWIEPPPCYADSDSESDDESHSNASS